MTVVKNCKQCKRWWNCKWRASREGHFHADCLWHTSQKCKCSTQPPRPPTPWHIQMFAILMNNEHLTMPIKGGGGSAQWRHWRFSAERERADEQKILKSNQAHLIKPTLSGNYLMETFVLMLSVLKQSRIWQRGGCGFSRRLKQKKTR